VTRRIVWSFDVMLGQGHSKAGPWVRLLTLVQPETSPKLAATPPTLRKITSKSKGSIRTEFSMSALASLSAETFVFAFKLTLHREGKLCNPISRN
jgi:hypothetical protein